MPDQIPPACVNLQTRLNSLSTQLAQLQQALADADPVEKKQAQIAVGKKQQEVNVAKVAYNNCLANPPVVDPPPPIHIPGVPDACVDLYKQLNGLNAQLTGLQEELANSGEADIPNIRHLIGAKQLQIQQTQISFNNCIVANSNPTFGIPPKATKPAINPDTTLTAVKKTISWEHVQKMMDEFFNHRTDLPIFNIRLDNDRSGAPPNSTATISLIEAKVVNGGVITEYKPVTTFDLGHLEHAFYFDDINSDKITVSLDPLAPEPLTVKINFECNGPEEMPNFSSLPVIGSIDFSVFYITLKFSFDLVRFPKSIPTQCNDLQTTVDTLKNDLVDLQREKSNPDTNQALLAKLINDKNKEIGQAQNNLNNCLVTNGGADPTGTGKLEFLSWVDKIKDLTDDDLDSAIGKYVVAHIEAGLTDLGGAAQKAFRSKIFDRLKDPVTRAQLNAMISRWILGGDGSYDVVSVDNSDGQNAVIKYLVPANKLDPFPDSIFRPSDWPYRGNTNPNIPLPVTNTNSLANIKHIVVLTMENRSFDHMLGYLSLPVSAGGMGRTDVDGLSVPDVNFNPMNNVNYPIFPIAAGDTAFDIDPNHSYEPVANQINGELDETDTNKKFFKPGTGKMNGFVKNFFDKAFAEKARNIMGYHTAVNVPMYDALARDFAISDRWFAAHPGPTFCNRFYEITGRLNLTNGLPLGEFGKEADVWEFSNSSPLTPVFNKTIFDFLTDYHQTIESGVTWKYYEHAYTFLRFFSKYTFDATNIVRIDDPVNGFFADAKNGTLPSVSYIDPQFIELPPNANCDGPVADIKLGQDLVQKVVEAVVASPQFANTLLIITYDEHGGFYDHVPPPEATPFDKDFPIKTYGVRVPAFFISPWVKPGSVIGRDANGAENHHFDHTSILKTIAARMMGKNPPYMGPRFADAQELSVVLDDKIRNPQFLPFIRYNFMYNASQNMLDVQNSIASAGTVLWQWDKNGTSAQDFSFEQTHDFVYIRTRAGNFYITVDMPDGANTIPPAAGFNIKQDVKYDGELMTNDPDKFNIKYQLWRLTPLDTNKNSFIITNCFFPNKMLQPVTAETGAQIVLVDKPSTITAAKTWLVTSPLINN